MKTENLVKASIVLKSHINELSMEIEYMHYPEVEKRVKNRLQFLSFLNHKLNGDFTQQIDPEFLYENFKNKTV